jgi:hypothetical protein
LYLKREKAVMLEKIKKNIDEYKFDKNKQYKILKEKNRVFRKQLKNSFNKQMEKFYEPMNEQRINDFSRILNKCMSERIIRKDNFNIPKVKLNIRNVYSRLYHNAVFLRDRMQNNKKLNLMNSNLSNSFNESDSFNSDMKREKNFKIKNIIKNSNGKEFTTKITPEIKRKCFLNYSGGPIKNNLYTINVNNKEFDNKKEINNLFLNYFGNRRKNNKNKTKQKIIINNSSKFPKIKRFIPIEELVKNDLEEINNYCNYLNSRSVERKKMQNNLRDYFGINNM